jgi:arylsulfatase A-like enzyme
VDGCFAGFVAALKQAGLYDRSIVIVTSDHGDSLGEGGRWGHAFFLEPEVMRVPLIIHLPSDLRARVAADTKAVAFATDITPTLYALLGHDPSDLGPLFGRPLFGPIDGPPPAPRPEPFLLGSSYGAVYGILRDNGRLLYTSDAEDARDFAFDLHGSGPGVPLALTADMTAENRRLIAGQLAGLAALNHLKR